MMNESCCGPVVELACNLFYSDTVGAGDDRLGKILPRKCEKRSDERKRLCAKRSNVGAYWGVRPKDTVCALGIKMRRRMVHCS